MRRALLLSGLLLFGACNLPPKDPFVAAERALRRNDLLRALQAYDAVPVKHERYPDARAAAGDVEQRLRRCHELILEALMLRAQWRDAEALGALNRAAVHWPGQPSLRLWIATTEKRMRLFTDREGVAAAAPGSPAAPLVETVPGPAGPTAVAMDVGSTLEVTQDDPATTRAPVEVPSRGPLPMVPMQGTRAADPTATANAKPPRAAQQASEQPHALSANQAPTTTLPPHVSTEQAARSVPAITASPGRPVASNPTDKPLRHASAAAAPQQLAPKSRRVPLADDPVALGLVSVAASLGRGELIVAVRDLIELARRFPGDARTNRRLSRLLHQRALMHYGAGAVAAAVADWQRVIEIDPGNDQVRRLLSRAIAELPPKK
ncbi:MAG TPA: hypothetical protein EYP98_02415 [Planctomycetes bacterium]|nr:hypothetical protein [Planctomycetota bacterium]